MRLVFSLAAAGLLVACCLLYFYPAYKNRHIIQDVSGIHVPADAKVVAHHSETSALGVSGIQIFKLEAASFNYPATQACSELGYRDLSADDLRTTPKIATFLTKGRSCISGSKGKLDGFSIRQGKFLVVVVFF